MSRTTLTKPKRAHTTDLCDLFPTARRLVAGEKWSKIKKELQFPKSYSAWNALGDLIRCVPKHVLETSGFHDLLEIKTAKALKLVLPYWEARARRGDKLTKASLAEECEINSSLHYLIGKLHWVLNARRAHKDGLTIEQISERFSMAIGDVKRLLDWDIET